MTHTIHTERGTIQSVLTPEQVARITLRPWQGPCATTGLTMLDFHNRMKSLGRLAPEITRAAVSIARSYAITGLCDVGYIANTIAGNLAPELRDGHEVREVCAGCGVTR